MNIFEFTIKRETFRECFQVYADDLPSALAELLRLVPERAILKVERV